ncbi:lipid droplet-associated protein [Tomitella fengzijianii]|uniref:Lipid droplet-associated protein n=1 Tax=Tomitella fengzijianii TaxID=2597660 RepID=A0A516X2A3_9ACTN|nr:lipid droplet-associated protein [Tomitella fengzijianii]QDQ97157.1 lipid droplet-associated protein [Tomitella fengzijianii]
MIRPPFMARVAAGVALTVADEVRQLPTTAIALPMTSVSLLLQTSMRLQQTMTSLAIRGDEAFAFLYPATEKPSWAVFDEDEAGDGGPESGTGPGTARDGSAPAAAPGQRGPSADGHGSLGRFALYSTPNAATRGRALENAATDVATAEAPAVAEEIGYDDLTLAQLRTRLRAMGAEDLSALLDYERAGTARAPYLTMLENRLASVAGK